MLKLRVCKECGLVVVPKGISICALCKQGKKKALYKSYVPKVVREGNCHHCRQPRGESTYAWTCQTCGEADAVRVRRWQYKKTSTERLKANLIRYEDMIKSISEVLTERGEGDWLNGRSEDDGQGSQGVSGETENANEGQSLTADTGRSAEPGPRDGRDELLGAPIR